ncbi:efflux RND transporter periplasmic adaptor subunit [Leptospira yasudae]|uniref:Efflux RND transporter periplasmic adaptor subunit n=1 Tax=Leptospira yasudae TaxID=2202201 RepID=A0A6N4QNH2_9LEPT|nr:efflux RND transporter periplasmic adaptor subunit [Leptospira yasudae]TGL79169.1 efflux RND transporter periplasmic adaptor subunit [Leptospira yasudae]TGL83083.1 efflux RND transporter periplasmic adaptor subunit [Leptospira yasudae]TGL85686.1 efflux RND transporter periplasmic adaptor subunit [Leptospira yasudae]
MIAKILTSKAGKYGLGIILSYFLVSLFLVRISKNSNSRILKNTTSMMTKPISFALPSQEKSEFEEDTSEKMSVLAMNVEMESITPMVEASGMIDFIEKVDIYSKVSGRIEKTYFKEGEDVSQNQRLFKMETLPLELELLKQESTMESSKSQVKLAREKYIKAKGNVLARIQEYEKSISVLEKNKQEYEKAKTTFAGIEEIYNAGGYSREEFETAKLNLHSKETAVQLAERDVEIRSIGLTDKDILRNNYKVPDSKEERIKILEEINSLIEKAEWEVTEGVLKAHEAQVNSTKMLLKESLVYSPITGVVSKQFKNEGEILTSSGPGQHVLSVINVKQVYAVLNIPESESIDLKKGMRVSFSADVFKGQEFVGIVQMVSPIIDQKSHTVEIKAIVDNKNKQLKPGMFIRANITTGKEKPTIRIPSTAVLLNEDNATGIVCVVRDGKSFRNEVKLGPQSEGKIVVSEGLINGDTILLERISQIRDGMPVNPLFDKR